MPFKRYYELDEKKRYLIMRTAISIFAEQSFQNASINKISKIAGLSAGALYYYFEDKKDLFYTSINFINAEIMSSEEQLIDYFNSDGFWQTITKVVHKRNELALAHPTYIRLMQRVMSSNDPMEIEAKKELLKSFYIIFEYGYENGYIRLDIPKELVLSIHLGMVMSVTEWTLNYHHILEENNTKEYDLEKISIEAVKMIKAAVSPTE
jgi:AcrR family transcriptional regulator